MQITFVCTGNTCRSPMAEAIAKQYAATHCPDNHYEITSVGLNTFNGSPASQHAINVCREIGIDLTSHRSQRLNPEIAEKTDLFAVMTPHHAAFLRQCGIPEDKITVLGGGIPDPFGGDEATYRACRDAIANAVADLFANIAAHDSPEGSAGNAL